MTALQTATTCTMAHPEKTLFLPRQNRNDPMDPRADENSTVHTTTDDRLRLLRTIDPRWCGSAGKGSLNLWESAPATACKGVLVTRN